MRLSTNQAVAIVVDIQERLFPHIHANQAMLSKCQILIKGLQILNIPLIVTEQYPKGLGGTIADVRDVVAEFNPIEKITFSSMRSDDVEARVLGMARHQIIVMGIEAHVCVLQTVLDIMANGHMAIVVADAISSRNPDDKAVAIERMRVAGAIVTTTESLLFELMEQAGTDTFKQISALVK